jgi:hypothetical protein
MKRLSVPAWGVLLLLILSGYAIALLALTCYPALRSIVASPAPPETSPVVWEFERQKALYWEWIKAGDPDIPLDSPDRWGNPRVLLWHDGRPIGIASPGPNGRWEGSAEGTENDDVVYFPHNAWWDIQEHGQTVVPIPDAPVPPENVIRAESGR